MNLFSRISILLGIMLLFFGAYLMYERNNPKRLEFKTIGRASSTVPDKYPTMIFIPKLNTKLAVFPAQVKNGNWDATTKGISYLSSSPTPGDAGNSILYGHNYPNLLGNLPEIKPGDEIIITLNDNQAKKFVVKYTSVVSPDQTQILKPSSDTRITLYTCTGFLDSKRFVVTAILKSELASSGI